MISTSLPTIPPDHLLQISLAQVSPPRPTPAPAASSKRDLAFNTNGWDTVFAVRLSDVNRAIQQSGVSPTTWQWNIPKSEFSPAIEATGRFTPYGNIQALSPDAIPDGARAGFNLSQERSFNKMLLANLPAQFSKANRSYFAVTHAGNQIENTKTSPLVSVRHAGVSYDPEMTTLRIQVNGDEIEIYSYIHIPIRVDRR